MLIWLAIVAAGVGLALILAGLPRRNRSGQQLCPKCRYDVSKTRLQRCSECGYAWSHVKELSMRPAHKRRLWVGALMLTLSLGSGLFAALLIKHWTHYLPSSIVLLLLDTFVNEEPPEFGMHIAQPNPAFRDSASRWKRLVWQKQTSYAIQRFIDMVEQSDGTMEDVKRLVPLANEVQEILQEWSSTQWEDAWPVRRVIEQIRGRREEIDAQFNLPIGTWLAAELQVYSGNPHEGYYWLEPPLDILIPLAQASNPSVRMYALARLTYLPKAAPIIYRMAKEDSDPDIRVAAMNIYEWQMYEFFRNQ